MLDICANRSRTWVRAPLMVFGVLAAGCGGGGGDTADWLFPLWTATSVRVVDLDGKRVDKLLVQHIGDTGAPYP